MNSWHEHPDPLARPSETLPPDLRRVDDRLAELASRQPLPEGLADRVYSASVAALPRKLRLVGGGAIHRPVRSRRAVWGQLAMAASVGLAFVLGAWFLAGGGPDVHQSGGGLIAGDLRESDSRVMTVAHRPTALSPEAERELFEAMSDGESIGYVLDARDLTWAQLEGDLARLFEELEL